MSGSGVTKEQASEKARSAAVEDYPNLDDFEMSVEESPTHWVFDFSKPSEISDGALQHFSVWVDKKTGETRLFKGR